MQCASSMTTRPVVAASLGSTSSRNPGLLSRSGLTSSTSTAPARPSPATASHSSRFADLIAPPSPPHAAYPARPADQRLERAPLFGAQPRVRPGERRHYLRSFDPDRVPFHPSLLPAPARRPRAGTENQQPSIDSSDVLLLAWHLACAVLPTWGGTHAGIVAFGSWSHRGLPVGGDARSAGGGASGRPAAGVQRRARAAAGPAPVRGPAGPPGPRPDDAGREDPGGGPDPGRDALPGDAAGRPAVRTGAAHEQRLGRREHRRADPVPGDRTAGPDRARRH